MKIGILTLQLHTNYGGILQAYALQTTLQRMGHEAYIITLIYQECKIIGWRKAVSPLVYAVRFGRRYICGDKSSFVFLEQKFNRERKIRMANTNAFISKYINVLECADYTTLSKDHVDAIVVGSDQVWRPIYFHGDIIHAYLDFAKDWSIKRVSYAASFGTDEWEYSEQQTLDCRALISKFDAVSVREDSAVELCKKHFDIDAKHLLDPTMLLDKEDYIKLVEAVNTAKSSGNLMVYILDITPDKQMLIDTIAKQRGLIPFTTRAKATDGDGGNILLPLEDRIQPPLEVWIRGFMDAEFVVADSFHACVFSIIFNKPFIVYGNMTRGNARFISLLKMFGLESQLIYSSDELNIDKCSMIDWDSVNMRLKALKKESIEFLTKSFV